MPKRLVSVFGGYEMGKSAISDQLAQTLGGLWCQTYPDVESRKAASAEGSVEHMINRYMEIGRVATETNLLVIDEDPIDTALMRALSQDKSPREIEDLQKSLARYAKTALGDVDIERSYLRMTTRSAVEIDGKVHNPLLHQIAARTLEIHNHEGVRPTPIEYDAVGALRAADQYAQYLEERGANIVSIDRNAPYDLDVLTRRLTS